MSTIAMDIKVVALRLCGFRSSFDILFWHTCIAFNNIKESFLCHPEALRKIFTIFYKSTCGGPADAVYKDTGAHTTIYCSSSDRY
jgi:hypothetical protein